MNEIQNIEHRNKNMNIVSLQRRLAATLIDKVLILFLFVIVALIFCSGHPGAELGTFTYSTSVKYKKIESKRTLYETQLDNKKYIEENGYGEYNIEDEEYEHYKTALDVYQKHIFIFVLVNLLYYFICEYFFRASLGKKILKCQIKKSDGSEINTRDIFLRSGILFALLLLAVVLQMSMNINAYITSIIFFGILDFTVFTRQQSLIDKYSDAYIVRVG